MQQNLIVGVMMLLSGSHLAADATPKDEILNAAKKLGDRPNYSWKTTVVVPEGSRFRPGPTEGKTEKDGLTCVSMTFGENTTRAFLKGDKAAISTQEGGWQSLSEVENSEGRGRFRAMIVRNIKTPAAQAAELVAAVKDLRQEGDVFAGDLSAVGAKAMLTFRPGGGGDGPEVSNATGSVKFWVKDGVLAKYVFKVEGKMTFNGNDIDVDRTTTVEVKDIGTTKVDVPEEAKKKLS